MLHVERVPVRVPELDPRHLQVHVEQIRRRTRVRQLYRDPVRTRPQGVPVDQCSGLRKTAIIADAGPQISAIVYGVPSTIGQRRGTGAIRTDRVVVYAILLAAQRVIDPRDHRVLPARREGGQIQRRVGDEVGRVGTRRREDVVPRIDRRRDLRPAHRKGVRRRAARRARKRRSRRVAEEELLPPVGDRVAVEVVDRRRQRRLGVRRGRALDRVEPGGLGGSRRPVARLRRVLEGRAAVVEAVVRHQAGGEGRPVDGGGEAIRDLIGGARRLPHAQLVQMADQPRAHGRQARARAVAGRRQRDLRAVGDAVDVERQTVALAVPDADQVRPCARRQGHRAARGDHLARRRRELDRRDVIVKAQLEAE